MTAGKPKFHYRYEITEIWGADCGVKPGSVILDNRYQGKSHEWLIYNLQRGELVASFKGKLIERVPINRLKEVQVK